MVFYQFNDCYKLTSIYDTNSKRLLSFVEQRIVKMKRFIVLIAIVMFNFSSSQTQIIAHRGFWNTHPATAENSIQSLKNAQGLKIYGSEFDVRMSKDGVLVVNHDEHINTLEISETLFKDLEKEKLSNGETLPTLEKYLKQGKKSKQVKLIVEIKPGKTPELENEMVMKTLEMVKRNQLENQCEFISFSLHLCQEIKRQNPNAIVQYLEGNLSPEQVKNTGLDGIDYHYSVFVEKHPEWISEAKKLGIITNVWTVNDEVIFNKLVEMGVDFVTTNVPDELMKHH